VWVVLRKGGLSGALGHKRATGNDLSLVNYSPMPGCCMALLWGWLWTSGTSLMQERIMQVGDSEHILNNCILV